MPTTTVTDTSVGSTEQPTIELEPELDAVGIEFEYPVAAEPDRAPATSAIRSRDLRNEVSGDWVLGEPDVPTGRMTGDHVGAEITSAVLNLHSTQPEVWYYRTIQEAEQMGYPFAATGYGETVFGLHLHISSLPDEKAHALFEMCQEPWMRVFVCSSVSQYSADPWRHGGVGSRGMNGERSFGNSRILRPDRRGPDNHFEWRLPEPVLPNHFGMVMHFLRLLEVEGVDAAREYALDAVENADERLTAVQQYQYYREHADDFLDVCADENTGRGGTDAHAAEYMMEIMGDQ